MWLCFFHDGPFLVVQVVWLSGCAVVYSSWDEPIRWMCCLQIHAMATPPSVLSMSYCWWENDQCEWDNEYCTNSYAYINRVNAEFQKLGARGITVSLRVP